MAKSRAMSTWNYRICEIEDKHGKWFEIREVYYDDKGCIIGWTEDGVAVGGETIDELCDSLDKYTFAKERTIVRVENGVKAIDTNKKILTVNLDKDTEQLLDSLVASLGMTKSEIVERAIKEELSQIEQSAPSPEAEEQS